MQNYSIRSKSSESAQILSEINVPIVKVLTIQNGPVSSILMQSVIHMNVQKQHLKIKGDLKDTY